MDAYKMGKVILGKYFQLTRVHSPSDLVRWHMSSTS